MEELNIDDRPKNHSRIEEKCWEIGFSMPSDLKIGSLLKTLVSSKPGGRFLELGTGIGLSLSWIVEGMDSNSKIISLDNDAQLIDLAKDHFGDEARIEIILADGAEWIQDHDGEKFDLIFADAWPGKYEQLDKTLNLLKIGGFYVVDDMIAQPNWPEGHHQKASRLIRELENRPDLNLTKMHWSTGILLAVKIE